MSPLRALPRALVAAVQRARAQHLHRLAASVAFYALFSLPALLVAAIHLAGVAYGEEAARGRLVAHVARHLGDDLASTVEAVIAAAVAAGAAQPWPRALALLALLLGASLTFVELQHGLNVIWGTSPTRRGLLGTAFKRLLSFAMVLLTGVALMTTMTASVAVKRFGGWLGEHLPPSIAPEVLRWLEPVAALTLLAVLFLLLFKLLPDGRVPWRRAAVGALVTASLLLLARTLVARYLGAVSIASVYGAAGSLVVLLVWVYACATVVLLGGAFAFAWEEARATPPPPAAAA